MTDHDDHEETCGNPCPYDDSCPQCAEYWQRVIDTGQFDPVTGQWVNDGGC